MYTVVAQREIPGTPEEVWTHLTRPGLLGRWFAEVTGFGPGSRFRFDFGDGDFHHGRVHEWTPAVAVSFRWSFLDLGPVTEVTWALLRRKAGTEVSIIERGALTVLEAECLRLGWSEFLMRLAKVVEGAPSARFAWRKMITFTTRVDGDLAGVLGALDDPSWYRRELAGIEARLEATDGPTGPRVGRLTHRGWDGAVTTLEVRPTRVGEADYLFVTHDGFGELPAAIAETTRRELVATWRRALAGLPVS